MTVSSTTNTNSYTGNGTNHSFAYGFKIFAAGDIEVIVRSVAGAETTKTLNTHYIVTNAGTDSGGNVLFKFNTGTSSDAHHDSTDYRPANNETVLLRRSLTLTQGTDYIENDTFSSNAHENALDRLTFITQALQEQSDRSIKISKTNTITSSEFTTSAALRANKLLAFNAAGEIAIDQEIGTFKGNSATTTTAAFVVRDIVKSTTTAQLNNIYICIQVSPIGTALTNTSYWVLIVDAFTSATSATTATTKAAEAAATLVTFQRQFHGAASSNPTANLDAGDLYFKTDGSGMKVYNGSAWEDVSPTDAEQTNINTVAGKATQITALAADAVIADMAILGTNAIVADMAILGTSAVVADMAILATSAIVADMAILGTDDVVTDMNVLGTADVVTDMNVLGTSANVTAMGLLGTSAVVEDMGLLATDVVIADMAQLANSTIIDDLAILATTAIVADLAILATNANVTAMGLLATSANVTAQGLLGTSAVVEDMGLLGVAGVIEDMGLLSVAGVIEDMGILGTSANVTAMSNVSGSITNVNTVASNLSGVNSFGDRYRVASSAPSSSLNSGDLYFNTNTNILNVYGASGWQNAGSSVNGTTARFHYDIGSAVTSVTGSDASSKTLAYDAGFIDVYVNGVRMSTADVTVTSGDTVTFAAALASGDEVDIVAYGNFAVANIVSTGALDSGTITSNFGSINNGASAITSTGVGSFGSLDISGAIDVDGTTNLDVVDIDGAVDMASTLTVGGVLTSNGGAVFNELSADVDFRVESNITTNALFVDGATGVVGVGVTPQTDWASAFEVIQYGQAGVLWANNNDNTARIGMNVKYDGALKYINTNKSTNLTLDSAGEFLFEVAPSGSAGSTITYTSAMKIHNNGVVSAPLGIALGVGTAKTASNVLDDYEEGTWTCTVTGSSANPSTAVTEGGTYTKIGRMVYAHVQLSNKNTSGASGAVRITGLPFEAGADNQATGNLMTYVGVSMDVDASNISPYVQASGASFYASKHQAGWAEITHNPVSNFYLSFSVTYVV